MTESHSVILFRHNTTLTLEWLKACLTYWPYLMRTLNFAGHGTVRWTSNPNRPDITVNWKERFCIVFIDWSLMDDSSMLCCHQWQYLWWKANDIYYASHVSHIHMPTLKVTHNYESVRSMSKTLNLIGPLMQGFKFVLHICKNIFSQTITIIIIVGRT